MNRRTMADTSGWITLAEHCSAAGAGFPVALRSGTTIPGYRRHPHLPHLKEAERGNPDGVRATGRPTVRRADTPAGAGGPRSERQRPKGNGNA